MRCGFHFSRQRDSTDEHPPQDKNKEEMNVLIKSLFLNKKLHRKCLDIIGVYSIRKATIFFTLIPMIL